MKKNLYLKELESEAIFILREVVAEFKKPVMLYSVGKDSSVMLHLARKAFFPSKIPFPLLHVDTGYKFREMYEFRDSFTKEIGVNLIIYRNEDAIEKEFHLNVKISINITGMTRLKLSDSSRYYSDSDSSRTTLMLKSR
mgnify:CR=1 FL=1